MKTKTRRTEKMHITNVLKTLYEMDIRDDKNDFITLLSKNTETKEDFLGKYPIVVKLLKQKLSIRKVTTESGITKATVEKISKVLKYGDPTLDPNPYLQQYADVLDGIISGKSQREVRDLTGVSLPTVNTVSMIAGFNYIESKRAKGLKTVDKRKALEDKKHEMQVFIMDLHEPWLNDKANIRKTTRDFFNEHKTFKFSEYFPDKELFWSVYHVYLNKHIDRENKKAYEEEQAIKNSILEFDNMNKEEDKRLLAKAEREKTVEANRLKKVESDKKLEEARVEQNRINHIEHVKRTKLSLIKYINAGINPYDKELDQMPSEYQLETYKGTSISDLYDEDLKPILDIREHLPEFEEYTKNNLKKYDESLVDELFTYRQVLDRLDDFNHLKGNPDHM